MSKRNTEKDYYELANSRGLKLINFILPKNIKIKILWECKKGHQWLTTYDNIAYNRSGCPYCSGHVRIVEKDYHSLAKSREFKWVGKELPKNVVTKTWWKCKKEHLWEATYNSINNGTGCPYCYGTAKKVEKDYYDLAKCRGLLWATEKLPKNVMIKTLWECKNGHQWAATYDNILHGSNCPCCQDIINGQRVSKPQRKLNDLLCGSLNYPEGKYRIDVAIMRNSQKIAVEYDCWYWHKGKEEHDAKRDKFLISRGWKVLHIKSGTLLPTKKQLRVIINYLLDTNNILYNLYLNDWRE